MRKAIRSGRLIHDKPGEKGYYHSTSLTVSLPRLYCEMAKLTHKDHMVVTVFDSENGPLVLMKKLSDDRLEELRNIVKLEDE
jgi:hypothetical protein